MATDLFGVNTSDAVFSPCVDPTCSDEFCEDRAHRQWRYRLIRIWDPSLPIVCFAMLNPSTAGREINDPTIRKCRGFTRLWGYGGFIGANLFALRATDPKELMGHPDPVGPENDAHISASATECALVVVAWGSHPMVSGRAAHVLGMLAGLGVTPRCLGRTKTGKPKHPLYVPYGDHQPYEVS